MCIFKACNVTTTIRHLDDVVMHCELLCDALSTILRCPTNYVVLSFKLCNMLAMTSWPIFGLRQVWSAT